MPCFDIVSRVEMSEVDNALANVAREMAQRYDFKGARCSVERRDGELVLLADDELKLKQLREMLQGHLARRGIEAGALDYKPFERAAGRSVRQIAGLRTGIDKQTGKTVMNAVKASKLKVKASLRGDELRIEGKQRDDLQQVMELVQELALERPLQYVNLRD